MEKRLYGLCMVVDVGQLGVLLGGRKRGKEEGERRGGRGGVYTQRTERLPQVPCDPSRAMYDKWLKRLGNGHTQDDT